MSAAEPMPQPQMIPAPELTEKSEPNLESQDQAEGTIARSSAAIVAILGRKVGKTVATAAALSSNAL
ncbi:hypothetical protein BDV93DRAFT_556953 [Ceratobasidium sp. AG-I]|nr:hypothetical protein BDV93DRAFT_556953 [Ceratobasidium sp. AG-I]